MAALKNQMQSMLPSADDDIRPEDYPQYKPDDFTGRSFAADSFQETKDRFMDAGKIDVDPDDPAIFTAYKRAVDYLKDTGLAGLGLADTAFKYAVGSVAQVMPTEQLEKRMARDLYSMPEAFGGAAGAKSITQLDDAADAFLAGSKQVAQKLKTEYDPTMVRSFVGATPPTYQKREDPLFSLSTSPDEVLNIYSLKSLMFREPIAEFAKTVNIPKKGLLGSEFLNQIKKNPSIPETSIQDEIIDPSKRYTRDELLNVVEGRGISQSFANIAKNKVTQFEQYQRQRRDAGFVGGTEIDYFDIPVVSNVGFPGKKFKAHSQHYEDGTLVHVRGSIIDSSVPFSEFNTGPNGEIVIDSTRNFTDFDNIIDKSNFLLVEEIQSDLLTKGYVKPKSPFDADFSKAIEDYNSFSSVSYQEAFSTIDKEIKNVVKELENDGVKIPKVGGLDFEEFDRFKNRAKEAGGYVTFEDLAKHLSVQDASFEDADSAILDLLQEDLNIVGPDLNEYSAEQFKIDSQVYHTVLGQFYPYYKDKGFKAYEENEKEFFTTIFEKLKNKKIDKEIDVTEFSDIYASYLTNVNKADSIKNVGLPPIRKNKQAVDEALKVLIAKAAQQGVDKIVIPPAERIALARGRELKKDKGDRFYRTYVTDLNKSLKELGDNYPVVVHRDVELPYLSKTDDGYGDVIFDDNILDDDVPLEDIQDFMDMEAVLQAAIDAQDPDAVIEASAKIFDAGNKGTILDISKLINEYKIEQPRQFAEGGVAMNKQMEMAFMQEGGLKDDGMRQDPVSGNEIPNGSMASEVRDDIPAQLSEGEYVVPADVVRFFGVKFFEDLRSEAKMGLQSMEANGRIGGEPVPMETGELSDEEFARLLQQELGGTLTTQNAEPIKAAEGTYVPGQMSSFNPDNYGLGFSLTPGYTPPAAVGTEPVVETEASCAAKGMVLGPDGVCIVAPQAKNDNDNDGPIVPAPAAGGGQGLGGAWYGEDEQKMLNDPEAYIKEQLARGGMLDSGLAKAGVMALPGGLGLILGGVNLYQDTKGIANARSALMVAKARGTLSAEKIKSLEDAISKDTQGNFIVDKDGQGLGVGTGINQFKDYLKDLGFTNMDKIISGRNKEFLEATNSRAGVKTPTSNSSDPPKPSKPVEPETPKFVDFGDRDRGTGIKVKTDDVTIKDRTDSSGKKAGDVGYKSKLKERKEKEKAIKEGQKAGKGYEGGYGFKKGGLASRKKKK